MPKEKRKLYDKVNGANMKKMQSRIFHWILINESKGYVAYFEAQGGPH